MADTNFWPGSILGNNLATKRYSAHVASVNTFTIFIAVILLANMAPRSKRSRTNQVNATKRFRVSQIDQQQSDNETASCETRDMLLNGRAQLNQEVNDDEDDDTFLDDDTFNARGSGRSTLGQCMISDIMNALQKLYYFSEADKYLKSPTRPGRSERSL
ncbi:hypothetical protein V1515DRAFT_586511 [Lipomyces mesembrius]